MFSLSARFRKSRTPGVEGTVYYVIKQGKSERNITGNIHGIDQSVMSDAKERIAFDLMTIYCVIESIFQSDNKIELDDIVEACASAILKTNPFEERIKRITEVNILFLTILPKFPNCSMTSLNRKEAFLSIILINRD